MPSKMKQAIFDYMKRRSNVTFAELNRQIDGFRIPDDTSLYMLNGESNIVLWWGMSQTAVDAMHALITDDWICMESTDELVYFCDGEGLTLPIAKRLNYSYKKPRWLPVVFNVAPSGVAPSDVRR